MDRKEYDREWKKARYKELKEKGLCCSCGKVSASKGKAQCEQCATSSRERTKKHHRKRIEVLRATGVCKCGKQARPKKRTCEQCSIKNAYSYQERRESGKCTNCQNDSENGFSQCVNCQEKTRTRNFEIYHKKKKTGLCNFCNKPSDTGKVYCELCFNKFKEKHKKLKIEVFMAYGGFKCSCCGETIDKFLTIDHINNNGNDHRRKIGSSSLYKWLKANNFPPEFQVLCYNCNLGKYLNGGKCPHNK